MNDDEALAEPLEAEIISAAAVRRPKRWSGVQAAALVLLLGGKMEEAAKAANVHHKTLRRWRRADWWQDVEREANGLYLSEARSICRAKVKALIEACDPPTVRWAAERIVDEFAPPSQRVEHAGRVEQVHDYRDLLAERLAGRFPAKDEA